MRISEKQDTQDFQDAFGNRILVIAREETGQAKELKLFIHKQAQELDFLIYLLLLKQMRITMVIQSQGVSYGDY